MVGTNQKNALIQFVSNLDIEMIDLILDSNITYLNLEKSNFIEKLTYCFNQFRKHGDFSLEITDGKCKFANETVHSYVFSGNQSKGYIEINIEAIEGKVVGLFECYCFSDRSFNTEEFRLYIDSEKGSPF